MIAAEDHPLKMSVATLAYDQGKQTYSLDLRMFLDDFMVVTQGGEESDYQVNSFVKKPSKALIKTYLADHFSFEINGDTLAMKVRKISFEELTIFVVFEVNDLPPPDEIKGIKAVDTIFVDRFANQRNVIHIELPEKKRRSLLFNAYHRDGSLSW